MNFIVDVDGTVADNSHRAHFVQGKPSADQDWAQFGSPHLVAKDLPIVRAKVVLEHLQDIGHRVIFLTGREENLRQTTLDWFRSVLAFPIESNWLFMRETGSRIPAVKHKQKVIESLHDLFNGEFVFIDDDLRNAEMYADYGVFLHAPACWDHFVVRCR